MTRPAMGIRDYHVEKRAVESVRLNIEVKEALFEIPADYRIQDFRRTRRVAGGRLKAQGTDLRQTSDAKNHQNQDKPQEGEQRSGDSSGGGAGRAGEIAIQKNPDKESKTRADGRKGVDDEDEWERFTREFIARFKLHDERGDAAWRILRDCQEQRSKYLGAQRERILRLQERLAVNKDDDADRLLLELESVLREFEDMKRPIDAIFEKQLKPRLDKLPTRAERAAVEASLRDP
jgi:hypothetical protein